MSFRTKLTLALLFVSVAGAGLTGAALVYGSYEAQMEQIAEKELLLAQNRAHTLQDDLQLVEAELSRLSALAEVDLADGDLEPEKRVLRYARKDSSLFQMAILLLDASGTCLWAEPSGACALGSGFGGDAWFRRLAAEARPIVQHEESSTSGPQVRVAVPIRRNDRFSGALVGLLSTEREARLRAALDLPLAPSGAVAVLDESGRPLLSLGSEASVRAIAEDRATRAALGGQLGRAWERDPAGRSWLEAYAPVPAAGWAVVIRQARDELDDDLDRELRIFSALLLLGVSLAVVAGWFLARLVTRPLLALRARVQGITRGELGRGPPPPATGGDEFADLARAFHQMDQSLSARDKEIRALASTLEAKVEARTAELRRAQEELLVSNRFAAMGKTAAAIAHELKNALNGLGVAVDLLASGNADAAHAAAIRVQVREEVARLRDISDNLNLFAGEPRLHVTPTDLAALARRSLEVLRPLVEQSGVELRLELGVEPLIVPCDAAKIQSTIVNLCKNALEAMEPQAFGEGLDGPRTERRHTLFVRARRDGPEAILEVLDTGAGIALEVLPRLFEPFFTTKRTGTGLGLAIARRVVEAHGGRLAAEPLERGALFRIALPATGRPAVADPNKTARTRATPPAEVRQAKARGLE